MTSIVSSAAAAATAPISARLGAICTGIADAVAGVRSRPSTVSREPTQPTTATATNDATASHQASTRERPGDVGRPDADDAQPGRLPPSLVALPDHRTR